MSGNARGTGLALRIREWDDNAEEGSDNAVERMKPFDGGVMLALASFFEAWDNDASVDSVSEAVKSLRETVEAVIE